MKILDLENHLTSETIIQRKSDLLFNEIDGEVVMLSIENSEYFGMDRIGTHIWNLIETPISFKSLIDKLKKHYEVEEEQCIRDTSLFLNKLLEKDLIVFQKQ